METILKQLNKKYLMASGFFLILIVLCSFFQNIEYWAYNFTTYFVSSFTYAKLYLFLLFSMFCFLLLSFNPKEFLKNKFKKIYSLSPYILVGSIIFSMLLGFLGYVIFSYNTNTSFTESYDIIDEYELSSNSFEHIHVNKPVISFVLKGVGINQLKSYDAGFPYMHYVPNIIYIFGALFLVLNFILILLFLIKTEENLSNLGKNYIIHPFLIIYMVVSYALLELTIDGGLFDRQVLMNFSILFILLFHCESNLKDLLKKTIKILYSLISVYILILVIVGLKNYLSLAMLLIFGVIYMFYPKSKKDNRILILILPLILLATDLNPHRSDSLFFSFILLYSIFFIFLFSVTYILFCKDKKYILIRKHFLNIISTTVIILFVLFNVHLPEYHTQHNTHSYINRQVTRSSRLYVFLPYNYSTHGGNLIASEGEYTIVKKNVDVRTNLGYLTDSINTLNKKFRPIQMVYGTCGPDRDLVLSGKIQILEGEFTPIKNLSGRIFYKANITECSIGEKCDLKYSISTPSCYINIELRRLLTAQFFRERGLKKFLILDASRRYDYLDYNNLEINQTNNINQTDT